MSLVLSVTYSFWALWIACSGQPDKAVLMKYETKEACELSAKDYAHCTTRCVEVVEKRGRE